ncbi:MAG: tryptophan 7-halogenase [Pseudomonadales bacterium]
MNEERLNSIVILGGGVAGWSAAAALTTHLQGLGIGVSIIDSTAEPVAGASVVPALPRLHQLLGIEEKKLMKACSGTFQLATHYVDWHNAGHDFFLGNGEYGARIGTVDFNQFVTYQRKQGSDLRYESFSVAAIAGALGRFSHPARDENNVLSTLGYTLHIDTQAYQRYLKNIAESLGVTVIDRDVIDVRLNDKNGAIESIEFNSGESVSADLYVDCSGAQATLIGDSLGVGYRDWSGILPCNRMMSVCTAGAQKPKALSTLVASAHGWIKQIPLRDKTVYQYHYRHPLSSDSDVADSLQEISRVVVQRPSAVIHFDPGCRDRFWQHNCVALGAAAGYTDSLNLGDLHLLQDDVLRLLKLLPQGLEFGPMAEEYNRLATEVYQQSRDFHAAHYCAQRYAQSVPSKEKSTQKFWPYCNSLERSELLSQVIELFMASGKLVYMEGDVVEESAWIALLYGLGFVPDDYDTFVQELDARQIKTHLVNMQQIIQKSAESLPSHVEYLDRYCPRGSPQ